MKKLQFFSILVFGWILILSFIPFTLAKTPGYVGIENNDTFIWNTTYDADPLEDLMEDYWEDQGACPAIVEQELDKIDMNEDLTQMKIAILDVDDKEKEPWGKEGVRIIYNFYLKEEGEEWDLEEEDETWAVWEYDDNVYAKLTGSFAAYITYFEWKRDYNEEDAQLEEHKFLHANNPWFVTTKMDWKKVKEEYKDHFDDYDEFKFELYKDKIGFEITLDEDEDDDIDVSTFIVEYDNNGVLVYYERQYDGDPIVIVEREGKFVYDNLIWIVLGIVGIIAVVVIIVIFLKRR